MEPKSNKQPTITKVIQLPTVTQFQIAIRKFSNWPTYQMIHSSEPQSKGTKKLYNIFGATCMIKVTFIKLSTVDGTAYRMRLS